MKKLLKKKVNVFGKEISVFVIALLGIAVVSAALVSYYGQITQTVTIASGVTFTGGNCVGNPVECTEDVSLSACESDESEIYTVDSSTSAVVPLSILTDKSPDEDGVDASTEFLLDATEIPWDDSPGVGYIGADFAAGREYVTVLTPGMTLDELDSLVFEQMVLSGYPASVNILLDVNGDGVFDSKKDLTDGLLTSGEDDVLKIEWAYNGVRPPFPYTDAGDYDRWFDVFDDVDIIDGTTNAWLYSVKPGGAEIVEGTLADWKTGKSRGTTCYYVTDDWYGDPCDDITVDGDTLVYGIQIESLGWIAASESKVRNIKINGGAVEQPSLLPEDDLRFKILTEADCLAVPDTYTLTTTVTAQS